MQHPSSSSHTPYSPIRWIFFKRDKVHSNGLPVSPDTGESCTLKMFFEKIRFVGLHKYSADFSDFRAGIRPFAKNFRLIFVQYAVSGDF